MAHRPSHVPKFGDWENEGNLPYTAYFEKARKGRGNEKTNRQDKPHMLANNSTELQASFFLKELEIKVKKGPDAERPIRQTEPSSAAFYDHRGHERSNGNRAKPESQRNSEASRSNHEQILSREEGTQRRPNPLHSNTVADRKTVQRMAGSACGIEDSRVHQNKHARVGGRGSGVSSHPKDRNASSESSTGPRFAPSTTGRPRPKSPDGYNAAVPRFGDWDESNPESGEAYTGIFNRVRQEKQNGAAGLPVSEKSPNQLLNKKKTKVRCKLLLRTEKCMPFCYVSLCDGKVL